ncbi:BREX-2 system phosphatase PglZ [Dietzia psychralcaliphila]|uniref:BREX-2 system phosphatase PglZ n=1 Tax=Dietzia psychralcaliphila TaxID=139021 RepID=UPI001C1E5A0A|nr:BREX-2 system phosphatase PglZ [Dietzia psychralcaliphila]
MTPASAGLAGSVSSSSSLGTATPADLIPLLHGLYRDKQHKRGLLVMHARPEWDGTELRVDDLTVPVHCCRTVLEIRDVVRHRKDPEVPWRVVLTDLPEEQIPQGVKEHFQPLGRMRELDPVGTLLGMFSADKTDGRIPRGRDDVRGLTTALADHRDSLAPTPTPVLTADHLYGSISTLVLGLEPDYRLADLLAWSATPDAHAAWDELASQLTSNVRAGLITWLCRTFTLTGPGIRSLWHKSGPRALLPAGLVAETLRTPDWQDTPTELTGARALFSHHIGTTLGDQSLREWGSAAAKAVRASLDNGQPLTAVLGEANRLIAGFEQNGGASLLAGSTVLPGAFQRRLDVYARGLASALDGGGETALLRGLEALRAHVEAERSRPDDLETAAALVRLHRWNRTEAAAVADRLRSVGHVEAMRAYVDELSWVDRAVNSAWRGFTADPKPAVGQSAADPDALGRRVLDRTLAARRAIDRCFAALVGARLADRSTAGDALLVEDVLSRVVAPLREAGPVESGRRGERALLVVVIDGLSVAAAHGLLEDVAARHATVWQRLDLASLGLDVAASALPSVTTASRTSLLRGELSLGGQQEERTGFAAMFPAHPSVSDGPLFHKADLDASIGDTVRSAIYDTKHVPVVGAVLNTVDDALDRSDPIATTWTTSRITHLDKLLDYARAVGRDVVLLSDHGHVVERSRIGKVTADGAVSARWRPAAGGPAGENERYVSGERILAPGASGAPQHSAVLAVDEDLRYTGKKAGYHGGASPAEVCAPVAVLVQSLDGLEEDSPFPAGPPVQDPWPAWWPIATAIENSRITPVTGTEQAAGQPTSGKTRRPSAPHTSFGRPATQDTNQVSLFDSLDAEEQTASPSAATTSSKKPTDSFAKLGRAPYFKERVEAQQLKPTPVELADVLRAIAANNGRMPIAVLGTTLRLNPLQINGTIARIQKVVNVDGMPVLEREDNDVVLASQTLFDQFGL